VRAAPTIGLLNDHASDQIPASHHVAAAASRLGWMDTLRVTAIAGVIVMHAGTAYILDIDWYYQERTTSALTPTLAAFPALVGGLLGLGPLFLLAGLLSAASLDRKGPGGFTRGRLLRLGQPMLAFLVLLDPLTDYLGALAEGEHPRLWPYLIDQTGDQGHRAAVVRGPAVAVQPGLRRAAGAAPGPRSRHGRYRPPVPGRRRRWDRGRVLCGPAGVAAGGGDLRQPQVGGLASGDRPVHPGCAGG
jgi:hypothetical protein